MCIGLGAVLLGVLCALMYSCWLRCLVKKERVSWWDTFTSIIVAAIISFGAAIALYNTEQEAERNHQRESLKESLGIAITYIKANHAIERVKHTVTSQGDQWDIIIMNKMPTVAFEEAVRSGLFTDSPGKDVYPIAAQLEIFNKHLDNLHVLARLVVDNKSYLSQLKDTGGLIDEIRKLVLDNCDILVKDLNLTLDSTVLKQSGLKSK